MHPKNRKTDFLFLFCLLKSCFRYAILHPQEKQSNQSHCCYTESAIYSNFSALKQNTVLFHTSKSFFMSEGEQYSLRLMSPDDASAVESLYHRSTSMLFPLSTFQTVSSPHFLSILLISEKNGKSSIIGVVSAGLIWESRLRGTREGYIYLFAVDKKYQRKGFGQFLMNLTFAILSTHLSCHRVMCDIQKSNQNGFEFLRKNGFNGQKVYRDFFRFGKNKKEDSIYMMKDFTDGDSCTKKTEFEIGKNVVASEQIQSMLENKLNMSFMSRIFGEPY